MQNQRPLISHEFKAHDKFLAVLVSMDEMLAKRVRDAGCRHCGGPLYRADYPRKPRGGLIAGVGEAQTRRRSFCCGREGCRARATPPSVLFLGRKVYLGIVVIVASLIAQAVGLKRESQEKSGVPKRTIGRWLSWWRDRFGESALFVTLRGRISGEVQTDDLPACLVERFRGDAEAKLRAMLRLISPITTVSVPIESSLLMLP